jgi:hypothetical protein
MKNLLTFEEFLNESSLNENLWYNDRGTKSTAKLSNGWDVEINTGDTLQDDLTGKSLGTKISIAITSEGPKTDSRYSVYRILGSPNKGAILFTEELFKNTAPPNSSGWRSIDRTINWYSDSPKKYTFKSVTVDAKAIPAELKDIYDELLKFV